MKKQYTDIFLDFDDTLYDTRGNSTMALREVFDLFGLSTYFPQPEAFFDNFWQTNVELWRQYSHGEISRSYIMEERFRRPLSTGNGLHVTKDLCDELSDTFLKLCSCKTGVIEGAPELLDYLKSKGYRLHICSNGFQEVQYKKLNASGLSSYFDHVILSDEVGALKPSKQFYEAALRIAGAKTESTVMIGDNYQNDIVGAMNAGMDAILFNRWERGFVPPEQVTYIVDELKEIVHIL